jgi:hypothetical protein
MKNGVFLIVIVGFVIHSCGTGGSSKIEHEIAGTYGKEYSIKSSILKVVPNLEDEP